MCVAFVKILLKVYLKFKRSCIVMSSYCIRPSYRLPETNAIYTVKTLSWDFRGSCWLHLQEQIMSHLPRLNICLWKSGRWLPVCTT